jgi:hypothetical protein
MSKTTNGNSTARLATIDELRETLLPQFFTTPPTDETLRLWFVEAKIPCFKANPIAKRGGGPVYWSVAGVEKFLRGRIISMPRRAEILCAR